MLPQQYSCDNPISRGGGGGGGGGWYIGEGGRGERRIGNRGGPSYKKFV